MVVLAGINVGSVFMDSYIDSKGFVSGVDGINSYCNSIFSGITKMLGIEWNNMKTQTSNKVVDISNTVALGFENIKNDIGCKIGTARGSVSSGFSGIWSDISTNVNNAKSDVSLGVGDIKDKFSGLGTFLNGDFNSDWTKAFDGIKKFFGGTWGGIEALLKTSINGCIGIVNKFIAGIWNSVRGVVNVIGNLIREFGSLLGFSNWGFTMPEAPKIPFLAKGGIVTQPTLAMVGERGKEAVLPLESNTDWMVGLANMIAGAVSGSVGQNINQSGGGNVIKLYLDGNQVAETIFEDIVNAAGRRGVSFQAVR